MDSSVWLPRYFDAQEVTDVAFDPSGLALHVSNDLIKFLFIGTCQYGVIGV
jgi:hypothetical protein